MNKADWSSINKAKFYIQDNWFEAFGVCVNFKPKDTDKYSLLTHLPLELRSHIISFLGNKSLWRSKHTKLQLPSNMDQNSIEEIIDNSYTDKNELIDNMTANNNIYQR